jgi:predicted membrane-bound mannosyltransferase
VLALASVGALIALWRVRRNRFALFAALWGFGLLAAYSLINYKTPWLMLSMLVPLALVGGYAIGVIYKANRVAALTALALALAVCAYQAYQVNLVHYDEDTYIYVYAHTKRSYVDLIREVERVAERAGTKFETPINVAAPEYWPMPWYFRNYKNVGYQGRVVQANNEAVIISSKAQNAEVQATNGARYQFVKDYEMRPGVTLSLYIRRDLAGR